MILQGPSRVYFFMKSLLVASYSRPPRQQLITLASWRMIINEPPRYYWPMVLHLYVKMQDTGNGAMQSYWGTLAHVAALLRLVRCEGDHQGKQRTNSDLYCCYGSQYCEPRREREITGAEREKSRQILPLCVGVKRPGTVERR